VAPDPHVTYGVAQEAAQTPPVQSWPAAHLVPQAPQFCGSVWKLVQNAEVPDPHALGVALGQAQLLPEQVWPTGHAWPQEPQLAASVPRLAQ
jgi:hypothetical protein